MELFIFDLAGYIGYFLILIIFLILAIIFAKKPHSWIWYSLGAIITFISIIGNQKKFDSRYSSNIVMEIMWPYWAIYFVLLAGAATIILLRYFKAKKIERLDSESKKTNFSETLSKIDIDENSETWECPDCGANNAKNSRCCKTCGKYK